MLSSNDTHPRASLAATFVRSPFATMDLPGVCVDAVAGGDRGKRRKVAAMLQVLASLGAHEKATL